MKTEIAIKFKGGKTERREIEAKDMRGTISIMRKSQKSNENIREMFFEVEDGSWHVNAGCPTIFIPIK